MKKTLSVKFWPPPDDAFMTFLAWEVVLLSIVDVVCWSLVLMGVISL